MSTGNPIKVLDVASIINGGCTNIDGLTLLVEMEKQFNLGYRVQLSLNNCPALTSSFLNSSIGEIFEKKGVAFLKENVSLINYKPSQARYIKDYIDTLIQFNTV